MEIDPSPRPRLNLLIPSIAPDKAFGGVITTIEIFLEVGRRCGADLRVILDDFDGKLDTTVLLKCARRAGVDNGEIEVLPRAVQTPKVSLRTGDVFVTHNWWTTLNLRALLDRQGAAFGRSWPFLYLIQDYEPFFYPFSSTHMTVRRAYSDERACWGVFNSGELHAFFHLQGHRTQKTFVFEPRLSSALRPFLDQGLIAKERRMLVYGRPSVPRNCYPAVKSGLRLWAERYPRAAEWEVISAGMPHKPLPLSSSKTMTSLGKLPLEAYAELLRKTAVGLSLMASPHPSYPPLEMAHFAVRTVTNGYMCKDLSQSHPNILSLPDVSAERIAEGLAAACDAFEADPDGGWRAQSGRPSFLETGPPAFLDEIAASLEADVWAA